jgi:hypothetical protein
MDNTRIYPIISQYRLSVEVLGEEGELWNFFSAVSRHHSYILPPVARSKFQIVREI